TVEQQGGSKIEWSLYARESVYIQTSQEWLRKKEWLEKLFPDMNWTLSNDAGTKIFTGQMNDELFSETIKLITTDKNRQSASYIIYTVAGTNWNQEVSKYTTATIDTLFDEKPVLFSCIKGEFNEGFHDFIQHSLAGL